MCSFLSHLIVFGFVFIFVILLGIVFNYIVLTYSQLGLFCTLSKYGYELTTILWVNPFPKVLMVYVTGVSKLTFGLHWGGV